MTPEAREAILQADRVVGYITYLDLIKDLVADKVTVGTGMMQEVDRCQQAVDLAVEGYKVVVVSSGDPGVYGMAGLVIELANKVAEEKTSSCTYRSRLKRCEHGGSCVRCSIDA